MVCNLLGMLLSNLDLLIINERRLVLWVELCPPTEKQDVDVLTPSTSFGNKVMTDVIS